MVTVETKDVGEVMDVYRKEFGHVETFEDRNEDYIKKEMLI